jgi:hypothetical protein
MTFLEKVHGIALLSTMDALNAALNCIFLAQNSLIGTTDGVNIGEYERNIKSSLENVESAQEILQAMLSQNLSMQKEAEARKNMEETFIKKFRDALLKSAKN